MSKRPTPEEVIDRYSSLLRTSERHQDLGSLPWSYAKSGYAEEIGLNHLLLGHREQGLSWLEESAQAYARAMRERRTPFMDDVQAYKAEKIHRIERAHAALGLIRVALVTGGATLRQAASRLRWLRVPHPLTPYVRAIASIVLERGREGRRRLGIFRSTLNELSRRDLSVLSGPLSPGPSPGLPATPGTPDVLEALLEADKDAFTESLGLSSQRFLRFAAHYETPVFREGLGWVSHAIRIGMELTQADIPKELREYIPWMW